MMLDEPPLCAFCHARPGTKKCSRCKCVSYCSANCQKQAWTLHRKQCVVAEKKDDEDTSVLDAAIAAFTGQPTNPLKPAPAPAPSSAFAGGFFAKEDTRTRHQRATDNINGTLNKAIKGNQHATILSALSEVLDDLLHPDCVGENAVEATEILATQVHAVERGCELVSDCGKMRAGHFHLPDGEGGKDLECATKLVELAKKLAPMQPNGDAFTCAAHRTLGDVHRRDADDVVGKRRALAEMTLADECADFHDVAALRSRAEIHMEIVQGPLCAKLPKEGAPLTREQETHLDLAIGDARLVLKLVDAGHDKKVAWDSAQLARYLYWTVGWRKLDVHTCEEARESWFLCQQMMAAHPDYGHIGHDMGENISRELWELGYRSEGVSALE